MTRLNFFTKRLLNARKINDHTEERTLKESNRFVYSKGYELRDTLFAGNDTTVFSFKEITDNGTKRRTRNKP